MAAIKLISKLTSSMANLSINSDPVFKVHAKGYSAHSGFYQ